MKFFRYLLLGIISYVVFMLLLFPASAVVDRIKLEPLNLTNITGPLWNGKIEKIEFPNTALPTGPDIILIENISWQPIPVALLKGAGAMQIDFSAYGGLGSGQVEQRANGNQAITEFNYKGKGEGISVLLDPFVKLDGDFILDVKELVLEKQLLKTMEAELLWNNAVLQIPTFAKLGSVVLKVNPKGAIHIADVSSEGGDLEIKGRIEIEKNGSFKSDITIETNPETPVALTDILRGIARPSSNGNFRIRRSGNVNKLM